MKTSNSHLRLVVYYGEETDPRIFDLPLPVATEADQRCAVTEGVKAFAQTLNEEVRRARTARKNISGLKSSWIQLAKKSYQQLTMNLRAACEQWPMTSQRRASK
jgi:hypothetical protein